jgi:hypothetical protein
MANQFDEVSKAMAQSQSRRQALGSLVQSALALAGGIGFLLNGKCYGDSSKKRCQAICGGDPTCVNACLNCNGTYCPPIGLGTPICCPHGTRCVHTPLGAPACG